MPVTSNPCLAQHLAKQVTGCNHFTNGYLSWVALVNGTSAKAASQVWEAVFLLLYSLFNNGG
jgi:hypothetical protein